MTRLNVPGCCAVNRFRIFGRMLFLIRGAGLEAVSARADSPLMS